MTVRTKITTAAKQLHRAGFRGARGPRAPGLPPTGDLPPNPSIFKTP